MEPTDVFLLSEHQRRTMTVTEEDAVYLSAEKPEETLMFLFWSAELVMVFLSVCLLTL